MQTPYLRSIRNFSDHVSSGWIDHFERLAIGCIDEFIVDEKLEESEPIAMPTFQACFPGHTDLLMLHCGLSVYRWLLVGSCGCGTRGQTEPMGKHLVSHKFREHFRRVNVRVYRWI